MTHHVTTRRLMILEVINEAASPINSDFKAPSILSVLLILPCQAYSFSTKSNMKSNEVISVEVRTVPLPLLGATLFLGYEKDGTNSKEAPLLICNGGCRILSYATNNDARQECEDLSVGMAWKHRAFGTGFGGGKIVVRCKDPQGIDKTALMKEISTALIDMGGHLVTGCDLNSSMQDMSLLADLTEGHGKHNTGYVLAGIGSSCCANTSTAFGVAASVSKVVSHIRHESETLTVLVLGTGKVGSVVSNLLLEDSRLRILVKDVVPGLAARACPQAEDVSSHDWPDLDFDILVPCAASHLVDLSIARRLKCRAICGASNLPICDEETFTYLSGNHIVFVPEAISSAGAIIQDSIEYFSPQEFNGADPTYIYGFIAAAVAMMTKRFLKCASNLPCGDMKSILAASLGVSPTNVPVGLKFIKWMRSVAEGNDKAVVDIVTGSLSRTSSQAKGRTDNPICLICPKEEKTPEMEC